MNQKMLDILDSYCQQMANTYGDDLLLPCGTAHIVYDDDNLDDDSIYFCIEVTKRFLDHPDDPGRPSYMHDYDPETARRILTDTLFLLNELLKIPEQDRWIYDEDEPDE